MTQLVSQILRKVCRAGVDLPRHSFGERLGRSGRLFLRVSERIVNGLLYHRGEIL